MLVYEMKILTLMTRINSEKLAEAFLIILKYRGTFFLSQSSMKNTPKWTSGMKKRRYYFAP